MLAIIAFAAGLISAPNLKFYGSSAYNAGSEHYEHNRALRTSAICTDTSWEACPTCTKEQFDYFPRSFSRFATAENAAGGQPSQQLAFIRINRCEISERAGVVGLATMLFVAAALLVLAKSSKRKERDFDLRQQTPSDYAVEVANPPSDASDASEWRTFFSQFGHVTALTIALDNEALVDKLVQRRRHAQQLEMMEAAAAAAAGEETSPQPSRLLPKLLFGSSTDAANAIRKKIQAIDDAVTSDLSQRKYGVTHVFAVFETERAQQQALGALGRFPRMKVFRNDVGGVKRNLLFRGSKLLECGRPNEPESVRWQDLDDSLLSRSARSVFTFFLTCVSIVAGCIVVIAIRLMKGPIYAAIAVSVSFMDFLLSQLFLGMLLSLSLARAFRISPNIE